MCQTISFAVFQERISLYTSLDATNTRHDTLSIASLYSVPPIPGVVRQPHTPNIPATSLTANFAASTA